MNKPISGNDEVRVAMRMLACILLCSLAQGCGGGGAAKSERAALRSRAEAFGSLLVRIQGMKEADAKKVLIEFIEPSPAQGERIAQYYREFSAGSKKFKIASQSVTNISLSPDLTNAEVTYQMQALAPGGMKVPFEQVTRWKKVDGKWYRTVGEPKKRLNQ